MQKKESFYLPTIPLFLQNIQPLFQDAFSKYGRVKNVWVARKPPGFAFVEMEDPRDADDAVRGLDGTRISGSRVKVSDNYHSA